MSASNLVLLGVIDEEITTAIQTSCFLNKIGGHPDFIEGLKGSVVCGLCQSTQNLVTQIYCPLDGSKYHRTLFIFCCRKPGCWSKSSGWTVLRQMLIDESHKTINGTKADPVTSWGDDANEWNLDDSFSSLSLSTNAKFTEEDSDSPINHEVAKTESRTPLNIKYSLPACFQHTCSTSYQSYYVNVFDEIDCVNQSNVPSAKYDNLDEAITSHCNLDDMATMTGKCKIAVEKYEPADHQDKIFHKFLKTVKLFPKQVMRYCYSGSPLLSKDITILPTHCSCGSKRVFEAQLMPALLPYLKDGDTMIEFSTVLIYTCSRNCTLDSEYSLTNEYAFYVDDPDLAYFKGQKGL